MCLTEVGLSYLQHFHASFAGRRMRDAGQQVSANWSSAWIYILMVLQLHAQQMQVIRDQFDWPESSITASCSLVYSSDIKFDKGLCLRCRYWDKISANTINEVFMRKSEKLYSCHWIGTDRLCCRPASIICTRLANYKDLVRSFRKMVKECVGLYSIWGYVAKRIV